MGRFADRVAQGGAPVETGSRCAVAALALKLAPEERAELIAALSLPFKEYPHTVCAQDMIEEFYRAPTGEEDFEPGPMEYPINFRPVSRHRNKTCSCIRYYPHLYEVSS